MDGYLSVNSPELFLTSYRHYIANPNPNPKPDPNSNPNPNPNPNPKINSGELSDKYQQM